MILLTGLVVSAVFLIVIGVTCSRRTMMDPVPFHLYAGLLLTIAFALGVSIPSAQGRQEKEADLHGELTQLLKLVDAREDPVFSAAVRGALARTIGRVNEEVVTAQRFNGGLLDIWYSDVFAVKEPLK